MRINKANHVYLYLILLVMPLIFWSGSSNKYGQIKWFFWCAAGLGYIIYSAFYLVRENWRLSLPPLAIILNAFAVLAFVSASWAVNVSATLRASLVLVLCLQVYYISFLTILDWRRFTNYWQLGAVLISGYGLWQTFSPLLRGASVYYPVATLGNPNFTAEFLAPLTIMTIVKILFDAGKYRSQILFDLGCGLIIISAIIVSRSSAALLALTISTSCILFFWLSRRNIASRKLLPFLALIIITLFIFFKITPLVKLNLSNFNWQNRNTQFRYYTYLSTLKMWQRNFWLGVGFNNFRFAYPPYRQQTEIDLSSPDVVTEKAHNEYLQVAAETGIGGVLLEIALLIILFKLFRGIVRAPDLSAPALAVSAGLLTFLAQAGFGFNLHNAATAALFFFLLGQLSQMGEKPLLQFKNPLPACSLWVRTPLLILVYSLAAGGLFFTGRLLWADYHLATAQETVKFGQESELRKSHLAALRDFQLAYQRDPQAVQSANGLALALLEKGEVNQTILILKDLLSRAPYYLPALNNLGLAYASQGEWDAAEEMFLKILSFDQKNLKALSALARLYQQTGRPWEATLCLKKITRIAPRQKVTFYNLAILAEKMLRWEQAVHLWRYYLKFDLKAAEAQKIAAHILDLQRKISPE